LDELSHIYSNRLELIVDDNYFPEAVAEYSPLTSHCTDDHVESDSGPAMSSKKSFQKAKAYENHDVDVLPHRISLLHHVVCSLVLNNKVSFIRCVPLRSIFIPSTKNVKKDHPDF
jgi:hypothetical protein